MKHFLRTASRRQHVIKPYPVINRTFAMTSIRAQTAHLLLDRISPDEQIHLVRDVAHSLDARSGKSDLSFAATLLQLRPDAEASKSLFSHLRNLVELGQLDPVAAVCIEYPEMGNEVLSQACVQIRDAANVLREASKEHFPVPVSGPEAVVVADRSSSSSSVDGNVQPVVDTIVVTCTHSLRLVNRLSSHAVFAGRIDDLFRPTLVLLGAANRELRLQAQETLFLLMIRRDRLSREDQQSIWMRVQDLTKSADKFYQALGYSLWLRWITSSAAVEPSILQSEQYWSSLINGLRYGDSERCKSSLQILRGSVKAAVEDPELLSTIAASSHSNECKSTHSNKSSIWLILASPPRNYTCSYVHCSW